MSKARARELATFLRTRRDRPSPADVGLPSGGRRRVKGLRREEVSVLASVGTTWYTWLEQGRDVHPSEEVLEAIAGALMLDPDERRHLLLLGGYGPRDVPLPACGVPNERAQAVLDAFTPNPAVLLSPKFDPIGYNAAYRFLIDDLELIPVAERNCAYLHFTHPDWIAGHEDHDEDCAAIVAKLRSYYADSVDDPSWQPLLERLQQESALFRRLWAQGNVHHDADRVKRIRSLRVGMLHLRNTSMLLQENLRLRVSLYTPADDDTRQRLARLQSMIEDGTAATPVRRRQLRIVD